MEAVVEVSRCISIYEHVKLGLGARIRNVLGGLTDNVWYECPAK